LTLFLNKPKIKDFKIQNFQEQQEREKDIPVPASVQRQRSRCSCPSICSRSQLNQRQQGIKRLIEDMSVNQSLHLTKQQRQEREASRARVWKKRWREDKIKNNIRK
jgi:hypothetical protein